MAAKRTIGVSVAAAGVAAAGVAVGVVRRTRQDTGDGPRAGRDPDGWKAVTVLADAEAMRPDGRFPHPLAALEDRLEISLRPASRERGTELHARFRPGEAPDPEALRVALRDTKSLLETGLVQQADPVPHGPRKPTPFGIVQDAIESRSKGAGLL
jgi:hypothetical protein